MKMNKNNSNKAVSPLIGILLMVAIVVILGAVIGVFVLDIGSSTSNPVSANIQIEQRTGGNIVLTILNPGNVDSLNVTHAAGTTPFPSTNSTEQVVISPSQHQGKTITLIGVVDGDEKVLRRYDPS